MPLDKMIEKNIREIKSPSMKRLITLSVYQSCKKYDSADGKCQRNIGKCYYGQLNKQNEIICEHYPKKDKGDSDKNINSDIFSRPAYR